MDIAGAFYEGQAVSWISKTGITSPFLYEKDDKNFLRGFYGGLVTTCGLANIGAPFGEHGLHGRIGNIPAEKINEIQPECKIVFFISTALELP